MIGGFSKAKNSACLGEFKRRKNATSDQSALRIILALCLLCKSTYLYNLFNSPIYKKSNLTRFFVKFGNITCIDGFQSKFDVKSDPSAVGSFLETSLFSRS